MATGRLGVSALPATTNTTVYTVPTGYYSVFNVSITNRNTTAVTVRLALATSGTPNDQDWIEFDTVIAPKGVFERTGLVAGPGLLVVCVASVNAVINATVYGIETSTT